MQHQSDRARGEVRLTLSWPDKLLSPNARVHWATRARKVRAARTDAGWALAAVCRQMPKWQAVALEMEFCPPDKRRRDKDNLIASMKAATDGIADALGIDDSKFISTYRMGEPVKGGAVLVTVRSV